MKKVKKYEPQNTRKTRAGLTDGEFALDVRHIYWCGPNENNDFSDECKLEESGKG